MLPSSAAIVLYRCIFGLWLRFSSYVCSRVTGGRKLKSARFGPNPLRKQGIWRIPWLPSTPTTTESASLRRGSLGTDFPCQHGVAVDGVFPASFPTNRMDIRAGVSWSSSIWNRWSRKYGGYIVFELQRSVSEPCPTLERSWEPSWIWSELNFISLWDGITTWDYISYVRGWNIHPRWRCLEAITRVASTTVSLQEVYGLRLFRRRLRQSFKQHTGLWWCCGSLASLLSTHPRRHNSLLIWGVNSKS